MTEPNLITSGLSREIKVDGHTLKIEIYRIESEPRWSLEVVDEDWNSSVWDDLFDTDQKALSEAMKVIKEEGMSAFRNSRNVIQFPKR